MVQSPRRPYDFATDIDHQGALLPTRPVAHTVPVSNGLPAPVSNGLPARPASRAAPDLQMRVRTHAIREVVVLEVAGRLADVVEDLDRAIQLALAEGRRGIACDLSGVIEGTEPGALEMLATAGRHVRDWPGAPVAVACPDPQVRDALAAHPLGSHLRVTASMFSAVSAVLKTPAPAVQWVRLAPHPTAPRASRDFVTRTLLDWGLGQLILSVGWVVSDLVTTSTARATTDIDVSVAWNLEALRLTVRDNRPELPGAPYPALDLPERRHSVVAGLSRAFGVLPTADGGKVLWAVLNAAKPSASSRRRPDPATSLQGPPLFRNVPGAAGLPLFARTRRAPL